MESNKSGFHIQNPLSYDSRSGETAFFQEIVFSSRIRLSRNIPELPFSHLFTRREFDLLKSVALEYIDEYAEDNLSLLDMQEISANEKRYLREKNLITAGMEKTGSSLLIKSNNDKYTIPVNDKDHFKIQVIRPGLSFSEAYRTADEVDEKLNRISAYSFDSQLGYLSPEISNIGTGMKVSALLHLPSLSYSGRINRVLEEINLEQMNLSGVLDGTGKTRGAFYILSNSITLGISEIDLLEMADVAVNRLIAMEDEERDNIYFNSRIDLEDRIHRSLGVLRHSVIISYPESLSLLSNVRLGVVLSLIKGITLNELNELMINIQSCHLEKIFERRIDSPQDSNILRSQYLKKILEQAG